MNTMETKWLSFPESFVSGYVICNCQYLTILTNKTCLEKQSVYSLFYSWPKQSLKCLNIFPSLGFPQLWPQAILKVAEHLTYTATYPTLSFWLDTTPPPWQMACKVTISGKHNFLFLLGGGSGGRCCMKVLRLQKYLHLKQIAFCFSKLRW